MLLTYLSLDRSVPFDREAFPVEICSPELEALICIVSMCGWLTTTVLHAARINRNSRT